jgi:hypothetical protein
MKKKNRFGYLSLLGLLGFLGFVTDHNLFFCSLDTLDMHIILTLLQMKCSKSIY